MSSPQNTKKLCVTEEEMSEKKPTPGQQKDPEFKEEDIVAGPKQIRVKTVDEQKEEHSNSSPQHVEEARSNDNNDNTNDGEEKITTTNNNTRDRHDLPHSFDDSSNPPQQQQQGHTGLLVSGSLLDPKIEAGLYGEKLDIGGQIVRIAPYFVWYTHDFGFSVIPRWLQWWFTPRGWWTNRRAYTQRYAAFYYTFVPRHIKWAPTLTTLFLFAISMLNTTDSCEVPLFISAGLNLAMAILFLATMPLRRPLENVFTTLQYALNCALGISRSFGKNDLAVILFYTVAAVAALNMVYVFAALLIELCVMWDAEISRFHCPGTINRETNQVDLDKEKRHD